MNILFQSEICHITEVNWIDDAFHVVFNEPILIKNFSSLYSCIYVILFNALNRRHTVTDHFAALLEKQMCNMAIAFNNRMKPASRRQTLLILMSW